MADDMMNLRSLVEKSAIAGFEAMLWPRKGFGFSDGWTFNDQNDLIAHLFGI